MVARGRISLPDTFGSQRIRRRAAGIRATAADSERRGGDMVELSAGGIPELSLAQQIGQLFMVGFHGDEPTPALLDLIANRGVGGVILFSRNLRSAAQTSTLTQALQQAARSAGHPAPLLIATDQENGLIRRLSADCTVFPGNMALGATDDDELVTAVAAATGRELHALGINLNLAPVADVNSNPTNPVIGVRSFGDDPRRVAEHVAAAVRGYRAVGVLATLKHFPGHGDTAVDSHVALPVLGRTLEELASCELPPFAAGIAAGAECVMMAHVALPRVTGDARLPATLAPVIVRDLLRGRLGFTGVVLSDCLEMSAIRETTGTARGTVLALAAGMDIALISHTLARQETALDAVHTAVRSGELAPEVVATAARRVLRLKRRALRWEPPAPAERAVVGGATHRELRDRAYARAITLVRDEAELLPLRLPPDARIVLTGEPPDVVSRAIDTNSNVGSLADAIGRRHRSVTRVAVSRVPTADELAALRTALAGAALAIVVTINAHLDRDQRALVAVARAAGTPLVGIAACDPYDVLALPELRTVLATYEYTSPALEAAAAVLFGERPPLGRLPVTLALPR
jgi:beta-N-acetylhexosaminidase